MTIERTIYKEPIQVTFLGSGTGELANLLDEHYYDSLSAGVQKFVELLPNGEYNLNTPEQTALYGYDLNLIVGDSGNGTVRKIVKEENASHVDISANSIIQSDSGRTINIPEDTDHFAILRIIDRKVFLEALLKHSPGPSPAKVTTKLTLK